MSIDEALGVAKTENADWLIVGDLCFMCFCAISVPLLFHISYCRLCF